MIDRHYGHLARDGREHAIKLLDALNAPEFDPWTLGGRRQESPQNRLATGVQGRLRKQSQRAVDVRWTSRPKIVANPGNRRS
jgi:hypothetical protein